MFKLVKKVDLSKFDWKDCVLEFESPTYGEMTKWQQEAAKDSKNLAVANQVTEMVKAKFIRGEGMDGDKKVAVTKENFDDLPFEVVLECITQISGGTPDPNF